MCEEGYYCNGGATVKNPDSLTAEGYQGETCVDRVNATSNDLCPAAHYCPTGESYDSRRKTRGGYAFWGGRVMIRGEKRRGKGALFRGLVAPQQNKTRKRLGDTLQPNHTSEAHSAFSSAFEQTRFTLLTHPRVLPLFPPFSEKDRPLQSRVRLGHRARRLDSPARLTAPPARPVTIAPITVPIMSRRYARRVSTVRGGTRSPQGAAKTTGSLHVFSLHSSSC